MTSIFPVENKEHPLISIIVPVFNERENIRSFLVSLRKALAAGAVSYEIIFVDDGSRDGTLEEIREFSLTDSRIRGLSLTRNFGSHQAIAAGISHCEGDAAVILPADLQDPPEIIPQFLAEWRRGYEVVWGVRTKREDAFGKRLLSGVFYRVLRRLAFPDYPPGGTGSFCLVDRKVIETLRGFTERNPVFFSLVSWAGFKQACVPYARRARERGNSKWGLGKLIKTGIDAVTAYSYLPLRLSAGMGIFFLFVSAAIILFVFFDRLIRREVQPGWPTLMISIYFLGGVQLLFLGVIGEYIWRISQDVKARPLFLVRERIGWDESKILRTPRL